MSSYTLYCTICEKHYNDKPQWLQHLLDDKHQEGARQQVLEEWDYKMKECVLVVFSSFPVASTGVLLEHFSVGLDLVTDFVWWRESPRLGLLLFESRKKLVEIFSTFGSSRGGDALLRMFVDNRTIEIKKASDISELELAALVPSLAKDGIAVDSKIAINNGEVSTEKTCVLSRIPSLEAPSLNELCCGRIEIVKDKNSVDHIFKNQLEHNYENIHRLFSKKQKKFKSCLKSTSSSVHSQLLQLQCIWDQVEIKYRYFGTALSLMRQIEALIQNQYPSCQVQVWMFRNWYLNLDLNRSNGKSEELFLYAYIEDLSVGTNSKSNYLNNNKIWRRLLSEVPGSSVSNDIGLGYLINFKKMDFKCQVVTSLKQFSEAQLSRLYKYLCTFSSLAYPLVIIVSYWTMVNCGKHLPVQSTSQDLPRQTSMLWLVMFFLCREKLVPTPRNVLDQPHKPLFGQNSVDIGFSADVKFSQEWRRSLMGDNYRSGSIYEKLVTLTLKFFQFCAHLKDQSCILNTMDAEIMVKEKLLSYDFNIREDYPFHLIRGEAIILTSTIKDLEKAQKQSIYMISPIAVGVMGFARRLPLFDMTFFENYVSKMCKTADNLQKILESKEESEKFLCGNFRLALKV